MFRACNLSRAIVVVALALGAASVKAQPPNAAIDAFDRGRHLLAEERYEEALDAFRRSHEVLPSPNSLLMAARSLRALGRLAEARRELRAAEREAAARQSTEPRYRATEEAAREEGAELDAHVARLRIRVEGAADGDVELHLDGRALEPGATDDVVYVEPGPVSVTGLRDGEVVARAELEAQPGADHDVALVVAPRAAPAPIAATAAATQEPPHLAAPARDFEATVEENAERSLLAPIGWTALALGVASAGVFTGLYAATDAHYHDSMARCAVTCREADVSQGRTLEALTNTFFVSALVLAPIGIAALVIAQLDAGSVEMALGPAGAQLRGRF